MAGPRLKSIKWWEGRRDVCGTVCIDTWWENLPLLAHVGNTPSQFLPPQQNRKQRLGKSYLLWMQEMFPLKHEQVRQRSHYSASGLTWHVLAEVRLLVSRAGLPVNTFHRREDISLPLWNYLKRRGGRLERWLSGLLSSFKSSHGVVTGQPRCQLFRSDFFPVTQVNSQNICQLFLVELLCIKKNPLESSWQCVLYNHN